MKSHLERFALTARNSPEYQGHGWGCAWLNKDRWDFHHSLKPIWEDDFEQFIDCRYFVAHARSAYRNEGIEIANNMPFTDGHRVFIFNGELRGVRIREDGRIGAEKVFNFVRRHDSGDTLYAIREAVRLLNSKTRYVRAMNFIIADRENGWLNSEYNEYSEYFQMHELLQEDLHIISSAPYAGESGWTAIDNHIVRRIL
ncbi:MAG: hypothetical protein OXI60_12205 [Acidiferrobacterales bacterium]|nr:hypothetical protein [Acidiferrobacterales bacterium]